jgi:hypothetical protein
MSSIFVQIASFNDKELAKTVNDCLLKSSGNNEIYFGIHECYIEDKTIFNNDNVSISYSKAPKNIGVGMSRYLANKFYNGEDFYLQIDSHSRFIKNWDSLCIDNIKKYTETGNTCVLTSYPAEYKYEYDNTEVISSNLVPTNIKFKKESYDLFIESRILEQHGVPIDSSFCSESVSAAFIFGEGDISSVIQNPAIFYFGEEILKAASLYTSGYNLMCPDQTVIFHLYGADSDRVPVWEIYPEESKELDSFSRNAVRLILSESRVGKRELGDKRSLEDFGRFIGVDFKEGLYL